MSISIWKRIIIAAWTEQHGPGAGWVVQI